jgi:Leucine-rich repeat (LRR) protein
MSNNTKVIKELSNLTGKDFRVFDSKLIIIEKILTICIGLDLMNLNLEDKVLEDIEKSLSNLKNLKGLSIAYNKKNEVPRFIRNFNNLETLNLQKNRYLTG